MRLLLDTHLLLWAVITPARLSTLASSLISDPQNDIVFSTVSIWETAIKQSRGLPQFRVDPANFRQTLLRGLYQELPVFGEHAVAVTALPLLHKDPFDRILIAQAIVEGIVLLTADRVVARYPGPIRLI